jgi:natural product biosynthesis luciferase-like monooxygenase protein
VDACGATGSSGCPSGITRIRRTRVKFSLLFFSSSATQGGGYRYLLDATRRIDGSAVDAVWVPERHFTEFGGLFPNPAVVGAAVATTTRHLRIRAGSVISPLHDPVRIAEEWAVVDNLSDGRVDVSFGSGWNANDFVLAPEQYERRREVMHQQIDVVRRLWRGESLARTNGAGVSFEVRTLPRPVQPELPVWLTVQSDKTFALAADAGLPVLTNLNFTTPEALTRRCASYRERLDPARSSRAAVAVMVHTHIADTAAAARATATPALRTYLRSNLDMRQQFAAGKPGGGAAVSPQTIDEIIEDGVARIIDQAGLIGDVPSLLERVAAFRAQGVDELACLVDFGVGHDDALRSVARLCDLADRSRS